jgi:hypothetical protein
MVAPVLVPLEDMTHTCVEGCMSNGAPVGYVLYSLHVCVWAHQI